MSYGKVVRRRERFLDAVLGLFGAGLALGLERPAPDFRSIADHYSDTREINDKKMPEWRPLRHCMMRPRLRRRS
ncbi:MAG: hypothetical protein ACT7A5_08855 [Ferrovibrionaceae bacterium]